MIRQMNDRRRLLKELLKTRMFSEASNQLGFDE